MSLAGSVTVSPSTVTRPAAMSVSLARREATPAAAMNFCRRIARAWQAGGGCFHTCDGSRAALPHADRAGRAALPRHAGVALGGVGRGGLCGDDRPAARAARGARRAGPVLDA